MRYAPINHAQALLNRQRIVAYRETLRRKEEERQDCNVLTEHSYIAVQCFSTKEIIPGSPPGKIVFLPVGSHWINAGTIDGGSFSGRVVVDESAFETISEQFNQMKESGRRVWLDFDHKSEASAGEITGFEWDPAQGVIASVLWSGEGDSAIKNRTYTSFSPSFLAGKSNGKIYGLATDSGLAAGALVNNPAFGAAMPTISAN